MVSGKKFYLSLCGAVELRAPSGKLVTPKLRKAQALLAYLALAKGRAIERITLQELLWSDRMPQQARDSLKQALSHIRRAFAEAKTSPLCTNGGPISLSSEALDIDILSANMENLPPLLEGFPVREAPFRSWVLETRKEFGGSQPQTPLIRLEAPSQSYRLLTIGFAPTCSTELNTDSGKVTTILCDGLARNLTQSGLFVLVHDDPHTPNETDLKLSITPLAFSDSVMLSLTLIRPQTGAVLWSASTWLETPIHEPMKLFRIASHYCQQIYDTVFRHRDMFSEENAVAVDAIHAINQIARLAPDNIAAAERALTRATNMLNQSSLYGWRAYLTAYQLEKQGSKNLEELRDSAEYFSAHALEMDHNNPLTCALVAHAHSFVLRDHEKAREILAPVRGMVGQNALLADTVGLVHFYSGRYDEACAHAKLASTLGQNNPMRYAFTTLLSASQMMLGRFDEAIASGRRALAQHPAGANFDYEPTLRTLAASYALANQSDEGFRMLRKLETQTQIRQADLTSVVYPNHDVYQMTKKGIGALYER